MYKNYLSLSIKDVVFLTLNKIGIKSASKYVFSDKIYNATFSIDRILRYEKIIQNHDNNFKFNFLNKNIVELGSGLNYGWAPFAIFHGCSEYTVVEPSADYRFLHNVHNRDNYFNLYFQYLNKMYPNKLTFQKFYELCLKKIKIFNRIQDLEILKYDYFMSNSVFEHIKDLNQCIKTISSHCKKQTSQLHIVDFGNHKSNTDVFNGIYDIDPDKDKKIKGINYFRSSDINKMFLKNNITIKEISLLNFELSSKINNYWEKYNIDDLKTGVSLFYK